MAIFEKVNLPKDLRQLEIDELHPLANEIREKIIQITSKKGGHPASNLGAIELTIALHYSFNTPIDKLIWDVSHQSYTHKILTGRKESIYNLREDNGCSGFTSPLESPYDVLHAGHAGTAISASLGIAAARDRKGTNEKVVSIVGDGSLTNGISLEGLNNVSEITKDFIIVLNDNRMSIAKNVGGISTYLNKIISKRGYNKFKKLIKKIILKIPKYGTKIRTTIGKIEEATKSILVPGVLFEELGIRYIGPINGHNIPHLIETFKHIKEFDSPVVVHTITEKGRGFQPAESRPEKFHSISCFDPDHGEKSTKTNLTYSSAFGQALEKLAYEYSDIAAVTAAMCYSTGLSDFAEKFPERFFDAGIAEEHSIVFSSGLAANGYKPVIAIYATFLQRALGCVFHDICLQNLPVIICTDRAGVVNDGPTHHGISDLSYLKNLPNISILYPINQDEMHKMLKAAYLKNSPVIIRYPRGKIPEFNCELEPLSWGKSIFLRKGRDISIWATGRECSTAIQVAEILSQKYNIEANVVNTRFIKPFDTDTLINNAQEMPIVTIEDNEIHGGLGGIIDKTLINTSHKGVMHFGWSDKIIPHGTIEGLRKKEGIYPENIASKIWEKFIRRC